MEAKQEDSIVGSDLPAIYQSANAVSSKTQSRYYTLMKAQFGLLLAIAAITSVSWESYTSIRQTVAFTTAILIVVIISLNAIVLQKQYDRSWFVSRAIAESVKVESWRFMMRTPPFDKEDRISNSLFLKALHEMIEVQHPIPSEFLGYTVDENEITQKMKIIRNEPIIDRKNCYMNNRVKDQKKWYAERSRYNLHEEEKWFYVFWILEVLAAIVAIAIVGYGISFLGSVGIFTTTAAIVFSWREAKRFRELNQSYGLISKELNIISEKGSEITNETDFAEFVSEVERTISREHTLWLARRMDSV